MDGITRLYNMTLTNPVSFDDVLLVPQYSEINSRKEVDLTCNITKLRSLEIPIVSANMDSVTEYPMAHAMGALGGLGIIHRYMSPQEQSRDCKMVRNAFSKQIIIAAAIGVKETSIELVESLVEAGANILVIDVAHGHHIKVAKTLKWLKDLNIITSDGLPLEIIAGNVATETGARFLADHGADAVKVGIGPGSICTTRIVTGHGFPQLSAIVLAAVGLKNTVPIIADGGIRNSGDIVKALAAGANTVMLGSMLAGTDESPGEILVEHGRKKKIYRGMASQESQESFFGNSPDAPEGVTTLVDYKGPVEHIIRRICGGIRSGITYSGARSIQELQNKADWIGLTPSGLHESKAMDPYVRG